MDGSSLSLQENLRALADLRRTNRLLFGSLPVKRALLAHLESGDRVLDLGTGAGDVADDLSRAARRRGKALTVIGVDFKLSHLVAGRRWHPRQHRVVARADALPFADGSVDWTFSSLLFHHFGLEDNRRILHEMRRISRRGVAIVDLRRSALLSTVIRPLLRWVARVGRVAAYDGVLSVRQSWPIIRVRGLAQEVEGSVVRRRFPFRFSLVLRKEGDQP